MPAGPPPPAEIGICVIYACSLLRRILRRSCTPHTWSGPGPVAERLERDLQLDRPAALEPTRADSPDGIPVSVGIPFVRVPGIAEHAQGIGGEAERVAPIVERIEGHAEDVVVTELAPVAAHFVREPGAGWRRVPDTRRHIDLASVEHDPAFGFLSCRGALVRCLLDEPGDGRNCAIHRLVEPAIEPNPLGELDGANRSPPVGVAGHDVGGDWRGWAVDDIEDRSAVGRHGRRKRHNRAGRVITRSVARERVVSRLPGRGGRDQQTRHDDSRGNGDNTPVKAENVHVFSAPSTSCERSALGVVARFDN